MKQLVSKVVLVLCGVLFAASASAQSFVRYSQDGGEIHWGMIHDDGIYQLVEAPYNSMDHTGEIVKR